MHLLNVAAIAAIAYSIGVHASLLALTGAALPALLLSMLPISLAGWGVREAAMVTGMGLLGVPAGLALTTSVAFGISMIIASLPGLPALMTRRSAFAVRPHEQAMDSYIAAH